MQASRPPSTSTDAGVPARPSVSPEPAWKRHPAFRFGMPFLAIAAIAAVILLLSRPGDSGAGNTELDAARPAAPAADAPKRGEAAPDFALRTLDGEITRLSDLRGKTVLINFWATWCGPCRQELPDIQAVYEQQQGDLVVLGVNAEGTSLDQAHRLASDFRDELGLTFPILLDAPDGVVFDQYQLKGLPDSFFVDRDGILREISFGPMNRDTLRKKLEATRRPRA